MIRTSGSIFFSPTGCITGRVVINYAVYYNSRKLSGKGTGTPEGIMKKTIIAILCLIMGISLLAGCGQKKTQGSGNEEAQAVRSELSGVWNQISEDGSPSLTDVGIPSGYQFYLDGTGVDTFWDLTFTYSTDGDKMHIAYDDSIAEDVDYIYEIEGDRLTMTRVDDNAITMVYQKEAEETESVEEGENAGETETETSTP